MDLLSDLAIALNPDLLMQQVGLEPDPWQRDLLRSDAPEILLLCSRQSGKSTTTAVLAAHCAITQAGSLTLLLSPSLRQSGELFRKCRQVMDAAAVKYVAESALRIELANGSRVLSLPGKEQTIRGFSGVDLLVIDEASRVDDPLYMAVRPMLAVSGGRIIALSTPFGKRGFFWQAWQDGGESWKRVKVPATECSRIPPAFLEAERLAVGEWWWKQEYMCEFVESQDQVFSYDEIMAAFSDEIEPLRFTSPLLKARQADQSGSQRLSIFGD